ncbi:MAG: nitronate monooxygenase [Planctomycetes bacterium]|nr:nitronate monooxygenase [Planctomycetota bacterium]
MRIPRIIQGGMGVGVSNWTLARAVARAGGMGVVSGTALDAVLARRLQLGDQAGHLRRSLARFPFPAMAERVLARWFVAEGKAPGAPFRATPMPRERPSRDALELAVVANFVEVDLAREGHDGPIGINYLEKIQLPTLPALYGALLAGVECVLMGAGIPRAIPGVLDRLAHGEEAELAFDVHGAGDGARHATHFDPRAFCGGAPPELARPAFLPIVSSATLAERFVRHATGRVDGFVVEGPTAGGHNAPPRGPLRLSEAGEPVYGERDRADLAAFRTLGLPFWLAGSQGTPERLAAALAEGAAGIQVGTAFAYCEESGLAPELRRRVLAALEAGELRVRTDPRASPTGFPFKVVELAGTSGVRATRRERACDLGYLRQAFATADGRVVWRCPAEPEADFTRKGGAPDDARERLCVCNGLLATIGLAQTRADGGEELPLVTASDELRSVLRFRSPGTGTYHAADVVATLLGTGSPAS